MSRGKEEIRRRSMPPHPYTKPWTVPEESAVPRKRISAFVMNLPDSAILFLDAFRGILVSDGIHDFSHVYDVMPLIHCYCFTRELESTKAEADIRSVCIPALVSPDCS